MNHSLDRSVRWNYGLGEIVRMSTLGFFAKKVISSFIYPLGFCLAVIFAGILLRGLTSRSRLGNTLVLVGAVLLTVFSFPITGYVLLRPLEVKAGPYADPAELNAKGVRYIVVLAGDWLREDVPPADGLGKSLYRVMEGVRLWKGCPESKLVLSGGSMPGLASSKKALAAIPLELGVPESAIILNNEAWDTEDEARIFSRIVGTSPFALVTSARHIPRAEALFKMRGLSPITCPCDFETWRSPPLYQWFLPNPEGLQKSMWAIHERVGALWYKVKRILKQPPGRTGAKAAQCAETQAE